ncbi:adenylate/guanylate cyclase domain-containing protein [bacterium]|nr:adenylate/guanylate cyclase domain-containing protein [bacterium]
MNNQKEIFPLQIQWKKAREVILFADLVNFFPLARKMTLDNLGSFMQGLYSFLGAEIQRRKGEVVSYVGDAALGIFRVGDCNGMDPEWCAALAAFHITKEVKKLGPDLEINVAIHSGEVIEGRWEEQGREIRTVLGDVVNRTAVMVGGKLKGIHATQPIVDTLGPRVNKEKVGIRFPGCSEDEFVFRLTSLVL